MTLKNQGRGQHIKYLLYAFTEQGVAMLSAVLHSDTAMEISINIMNAFIEMRKFILNNQLLFQKISDIELKQIEYQNLSDERFNKIFTYIENRKEQNQKKIFEGQIWDSYSLIVDIIKKAKNKITIIDNVELYHIGASIKDLGKKCFAISKMEDVDYIIRLNEKISGAST